MALHNSGGIADLPVAVTDLTNSLNSIAAMSGMKYCHIPPHGTPYDGGGGSGGGPGVSQLISYPATVNGVMSFPGPRGPLQSAAVFGQMQTASGPPTAAAAASPASGNVGTDLASFNTAVVGGPNGPGNAAPPNGLESPHSSVAGATTMVLSQSPARGVHMVQQQFPPQRIVQASATMIESGYYVSPCWAPAGQPPPLQQQQQFDETGQLVGLNASTVSTCGPGMPTANRRLVQQPPPIPNPGLAAPPTPTLDPRYVPSNLPHASPHPMYHSVNNICIPPTPAYLMHDTGAPLNHDLANFGPLGPAGLSPTSGQPRVFMPSAAATAAAQFRLSMDPRSAVAALQLRPSGAGCCFPVSGVGNGVSAASGPMPAVDPNGLRPPFGSEPLVSTPPRKAAEPRKKRAKATKNPAGKQRNTVRTNRGSATTAAAAAAQATAAAAASVQKRQSESEAPRVTPPPPPPPQLIGSPVMLTSQSSMPLPTSKSSPPMGSDWMRVNSVPPPTSLACTPPSKPAPPPPPNSYLQNPNPSLNPYTNVTAPASYMSANGIVGCNTPSDACPPPVQPNNAHNTTSTTTAAAPVSVSTSSTEERLVCPITNGNLWGPAVLEMDEEQSHRSPNDLQVRSFEFEINADYLDTIVKRLDLDIVVCSHLSSEPLQVCHWPDEAVNIRFNGTLLNLDRSTSVDGQPAHKVCCVKNLCRAGRNILEFILSTRNGLCMQTNSSLQASTGNTGIGGLKSHEFAAFMVHMPAFNALLEGLQRRQPAAPSLLCQLILSSWNSRHPNSPLDPHQLSIQSVIAEISLICPVFRTRMQVPGRIVGCQHVDMFDMEAYLHREAVWPRLACPICGNKSPAGINGLSIDASLIHTMALAPKSATSIQVRSDGFWRLTPPLAWQLPASIDQWQPIVGPHTYAFSLALQVGAVCVTDPPLGPQQQPQQQQQQQKSFAGRPTKRIFDDAALSESKLLTGADGEAVTPAKKFVSHASPVPPAFSSALPPSSVGSQTGIVSPSVVNGPSSVLSQTEGTPTKEKWNAETTPQQNSPIPPGLNCAPEQRRVSSAGCTPVTRPVAGQSFQQQQQFVVPSYDSEYAVAPCRTSVTRRNSASTPAPEAGTMGYSPSPSKSATGLGGPELSTAPPSQKSSTDYLSPCGTPQTGCIVSSSISIACTPTVSQYAVNNLYFSTPAPSMRDTSESGTASPFAKPPPPPPPQLLSNTTSRGVASIDSTDSFRPPPPRICHSEMSNASEIISLSESSCNQVSDSPKFSTSGSLTNGSSDKAFHFSDGHEPPRSSGDASRDSSGNTDLQKSAGEEFKTCRSAPTLTAAPSHIELHFLINTLPESLLECALERTQSLDSFLQTDYLNYVMGL